MSRDGSVELDWADGTYTFRLAWKQLVALQEAVDAGPYRILERLYDGSWRVQDISNVIRLGLIGGGLTPAKALELTRTYVEERPPLENTLFAQAILSCSLLGTEDEQVQKKRAEATNGSTTYPTEKFDSHQSTDSVKQ